MDIISGLAAASQALEIAKQLREFDKSFQDAEYKLKIAELYTALSDTKMALADAREALQSKDATIADLKRVQAGKMRTVAYKGFNFGIDAKGEPIGRPYCNVCEQKTGLQVQISNVHGVIYCSQCKTTHPASPKELPREFWPSS